MTFIRQYLAEAQEILQKLDANAIERAVEVLARTRETGGRLFILGVGGSAANASHAVNDFRKIADLECYTPTDNVSELTARTNDEGWPGVFEGWLRGSRCRAGDTVLVLSVGGGDAARNVSPNLVRAIDYARAQGAAVVGVVGRDGGHTARVADACVVIPTVNAAHVTPHVEAMQAVVCHLFVTHPALKRAETKWESVAKRRAVFLDRDGVINRAILRDGRPDSPVTADELEIVPEAAECLESLKKLGFLLVVVTNQPGLARGTVPPGQVEAMHALLRARLPLDDVLVCPHDDGDHCSCRKPLPGLLIEAASRHGIDLGSSYLIGDRWKDIDAGAAAGCRTVLLDHGYAERAPHSPPDGRATSLAQATAWIRRRAQEPGC